MAEYKSKVLIIGSGPAGYTAGIYAARAGLKPILISGNQTGGQLTITNEIENFPGFPEPISGTELMQRMKEQAQNVGVTIVDDIISEVDFSHRPFHCNSEANNLFIGESVIIATGASAKWIGLESEKKFLGYGVSACATCDGFFYRNRDVAIIGGGNTAAQEALYLTNFAKTVFLIHRRDNLRADSVLQERLKNNPKINIIWDSVIEEIKGTEKPLSVNTLILKNIKTDTLQELKVEGLFVAIGHHPNTDIFKGQLALTSEGYITTDANSRQTSVPGVFAAGDVQEVNFRQAIVAAGTGCIAALEAEKFVNEAPLLQTAILP